MERAMLRFPGTESLPNEEIERIDRYWRAANYLSVSQIYPLDTPLRNEPLLPEHVEIRDWAWSPRLETPDASSSRQPSRPSA